MAETAEEWVDDGAEAPEVEVSQPTMNHQEPRLCRELSSRLHIYPPKSPATMGLVIYFFSEDMKCVGLDLYAPTRFLHLTSTPQLRLVYYPSCTTCSVGDARWQHGYSGVVSNRRDMQVVVGFSTTTRWIN